MKSIDREIDILIRYAKSADRTAERTRYDDRRERAIGRAGAFRLAAARLGVIRRKLERLEIQTIGGGA